MTIDEAIRRIRQCAEQMHARYQKSVFDEWAIISISENRGKLQMYSGPRRTDFEKRFLEDIRPLRAQLHSTDHGPGDFEFSRTATGTQFDAFLVLGDGLFLLCNNTARSMDIITRDPLWLAAQVPFVELSDAMRQSPIEALITV